MQQASAAVSLRMPVIPWYSVLRGGYVDLITKQPVTNTMTAATVAPLAPAAQGAFQPQNSLLNPAPRPTSRTVFPITLPNLDFWEKCFKETDTLRCAAWGAGAEGARTAAAVRASGREGSLWAEKAPGRCRHWRATASVRWPRESTSRHARAALLLGRRGSRPSARNVQAM